MTELQMGLIGLGATTVVGVLAYNKWQEYRHRKQAEQLLNVRHADVLLDAADAGQAPGGNPGSQADADAETQVSVAAASVAPPEAAESVPTPAPTPTPPGERIEPVLRADAEPEPLRAQREAFAEPAEPAVSLAAAAPEPVAAAIPPRPADEPREIKDVAEPVHLLSPLVDYVAAFEAVEPASASQILEAQREALARIRKPLHWIGYNELTREWEPIVDDGQSEYRRIRVGLQLVDRKGPLGGGDLSMFHVAMQKLADRLLATADLPSRQPTLEAAARLDAFCAGVDIQIGINVVSQVQPFPGTKLRALAEAAGMVIDDEGRFVRCDDDGHVLYALLNQEGQGFSVESMKTMTTHALTFLLDVPRVAHGERVFNQMVDLARRFADVLRGVLVDDNRRPLSEGALEPIRRQVAQYQSTMAAQGLPAGGPLTRRLFS
jgi:hypothetical protein